MGLKRVLPRQLFFAAVGRVVALSLGLLPRHLRYSVSVTLARLIAPTLHLMSFDRRLRRFCAEKKILMIDTIQERALYLFLTAITNQGARFDPICRIEALDLLDAALCQRRGVLLIGPHAMLNALLHRYLYDRSCLFNVLSAAEHAYLGTDQRIPCIDPSDKPLLRIRSLFKKNGRVFAMVDRTDWWERRVSVFESETGRLPVSVALIRLALSCQAEILFSTAHLDCHGDVVVKISKPSSNEWTAESIAREFWMFVESNVRQRRCVI
jgi:lauroyl/myristoyl acyltransferase